MPEWKIERESGKPPRQLMRLVMNFNRVMKILWWYWCWWWWWWWQLWWWWWWWPGMRCPAHGRGCRDRHRGCRRNGLGSGTDIIDHDFHYYQYWHHLSWFLLLSVLTSLIMIFIIISTVIIDHDFHYHRYWHHWSWLL